jgi:signal transduction histidine kinase
MARKCFMCGGEVSEGIICGKCDKPRKKSGATQQAAEAKPPAPEPPPPVQQQQQPQAPPQPSRGDSGRQAVMVAAQLEDPFPKAPILPFPVESASPAITSVVNLLIATGGASILVGPDRSVKFVSDDAKKLFDATHAELAQLSAIETKAGVRVGDLSIPASAGVRIGNRNFIYTLVPMSGGASGAALVFRHTDPMNEAHASFVTYVRETVFGPLRALRDSVDSAAQAKHDHFLADAVSSLDQVLSSLELAPEVEEASFAVRPVPTVTEVVRRVAERFRAHADLKGIRLDIDVQELEERFGDHEQLADSLAILMENALHYVPASGQVVIGVRWMEHKGKPLLLFFVMDNGPMVPEPLRQAIFEPSFTWSPASADRTGRGLFRTREFAVAHAGSVWVESKTGKACTFFLRVRPDGVL